MHVHVLLPTYFLNALLCSVVEVKTSSPLGLTKSEVYNISDIDWGINFTWTPTDGSAVNNEFCFQPKTSSG